HFFGGQLRTWAGSQLRSTSMTREQWDGAVLQVRAELPRTVDAITTLVEMQTDSSHITYVYSLSLNDVTDAWRDHMRDGARTSACDLLRDLSFYDRIGHLYRRADGTALFNMEFRRSDCSAR